MEVAIITPYLPWPADTGGKLRSYYLIRGLAEAAVVDLYTVCYGPPPAPGPLADFCRAVDITVLTPPQVRWPQWQALTQLLPRSVTYFRTEASMASIRQKLNHAYDLLFVDEICMAPYMLDLSNHQQTPRVVMRHKIDHLHYIEVAQRRPLGIPKLLDWLEAQRLKRFEYRFMPCFDGAVVCSAEDGAVVADQNSKIAIESIVNGADIEFFIPMRQPSPDPTILLMGTMHYYPNIDAVQYFFQTMYSALMAALPNLKVLVVGHLPPPEIVALGNLPGVTVTGSVPDVRPYLAQSWLLAVPLRLGGGTRLKIVEAMASGLPVVSTSTGAQGIDAQDGEHLLLADTPEAFVRQTVRLLNDAALREQLVQKSQILVHERYSWQALGRQFARFFQEVYQAKSAAPGPAVQSQHHRQRQIKANPTA